jgi:hypothetical protein
MTEQEIAEALEIPWFKLAEWGKDPTLLQELLSLALIKGFQYGQTQTCKDYNKAFREYNGANITARR